MLTVQAFLEGFLVKWETAKHSVDPDDSGNWYKGELVGSKYGVTGKALASFRKVAKVTKSDMAGVTLAEAAMIARVVYYDEPNFDLLPWGPVVASAVDMCYLSGPISAIKCLQRAAGERDDGHIGKDTVSGVATANRQPEKFADRFCGARFDRYEEIIAAQPVKAKYRKGWKNRAASYLPGTPWWKSWNMPTELPFELTPDKTSQYVAQVEANYIASKGSPELYPGETADETRQANMAILATGTSPQLGAVPATNEAQSVQTALGLTRNDVTAILANKPATVLEHVIEGGKLKLGEKSTWIGGAIAVGSVLADPSVQAALTPALNAIRSGHWGGLLSAAIGLGLVLARSRSTPRTDAVIAAKRLIDPG